MQSEYKIKIAELIERAMAMANTLNENGKVEAAQEIFASVDRVLGFDFEDDDETVKVAVTYPGGFNRPRTIPEDMDGVWRAALDRLKKEGTLTLDDDTPNYEEAIRVYKDILKGYLEIPDTVKATTKRSSLMSFVAADNEVIVGRMNGPELYTATKDDFAAYFMGFIVLNDDQVQARIVLSGNTPRGFIPETKIAASEYFAVNETTTLENAVDKAADYLVKWFHTIEYIQADEVATIDTKAVKQLEEKFNKERQ